MLSFQLVLPPCVRGRSGTPQRGRAVDVVLPKRPERAIGSAYSRQLCPCGVQADDPASGLLYGCSITNFKGRLHAHIQSVFLLGLMRD